MNTKRLTLSIALSLLLIATAVLLPIPAEKVNAEGGGYDTTPPKITAVRLIGSNKAAFRPGGIKFEIDLIEEETGVGLLDVFFKLVGGEATIRGGAIDWIEEDGSSPIVYTGTYKGYISVGVDTPIGEYKLDSAVAIDGGGNHGYFSVNDNEALSIFVEDEFDYAYAPGLFNLDAPGLPQGLRDMEVGGTMKVMPRNPNILKKETLDAIKGQDKTIVIDMNTIRWVIKGTDITGTTKNIDVNVKIVDIDKGGTIYKDTYKVDGVKKTTIVYAPENLIVITFAPNGQLPGKMQVRFRADALRRETEGYKYYATGNALTYEGETDDMVFDGTKKWCHMTITHNSTFVASNSNKLNGKKFGLATKLKNKTYTLSFNLNKGKVEKKIKVWGKSIKKGIKKISSIRQNCTYTYTPPKPMYGTLPTLTRKGYKFLGWYVGAKKVTAKTKVSNTSTTLKAKWKKNKTKGK